MERVSIMGQDEFGTVRLSARDTTLTVSANAPEVGRALDEISAIKVTEGNGEIALKARFITDVLKAVDDDEIAIKMTGGSTSPVILTQVESEPAKPVRFLYLIMPVSLNV